MTKHVIHAHSSVSTNGVPKLPHVNRIEYGEIAINYAASAETISFKNTNNELVQIKTDEYYQVKFDEINQTIEDDELITANALNDLNARLDAVTDGVNTTTSTANIPITKRLCVATVTSNGTFSLASTPLVGREIHVIVKNTSSSDIIITIPSNSLYNNNGVDSLTVNGGSFGEINAISDGSTVYIRTI